MVEATELENIALQEQVTKEMDALGSDLDAALTGKTTENAVLQLDSLSDAEFAELDDALITTGVLPQNTHLDEYKLVIRRQAVKTSSSRPSTLLTIGIEDASFRFREDDFVDVANQQRDALSQEFRYSITRYTPATDAAVMTEGKASSNIGTYISRARQGYENRTKLIVQLDKIDQIVQQAARSVYRKELPNEGDLKLIQVVRRIMNARATKSTVPVKVAQVPSQPVHV